MALLRKLFYRKPPDGLLEICERVYVFDCCFTTDVCEEEMYKGYAGGVMSQLRDHYPDVSILVFNFCEGVSQSLMANILYEYDLTIMDYPQHYEGCPLLSTEVMHHFLRSSETWLSLGQQNVLLMHCEPGGWPVLAFMLAALLIYRKHYTGEQKTLDMIYKQAPRELLYLLQPLNPIPSQLRYLQYVARRNVNMQWPPLDRALTLDCIIIRAIPDFDGEGGCRPIFRIYGQDPSLVSDRSPKILFSTPRKNKVVRHYKQAECELVKIDINCHIQGDVVLECICLHDDFKREQMMFRAMFNTAFIRSNILMLNRYELDTLWHAKDQFPKDFRAEVLFSEMDTAASVLPVDLSCFEEKDGLPVEAFAKVQELFNGVEWTNPEDDATLWLLQQITTSGLIQEKLESTPSLSSDTSMLPDQADLETSGTVPSASQASPPRTQCSPIVSLKDDRPTTSQSDAPLLPRTAQQPAGERESTSSSLTVEQPIDEAAKKEPTQPLHPSKSCPPSLAPPGSSSPSADIPFIKRLEQQLVQRSNFSPPPPPLPPLPQHPTPPWNKNVASVGGSPQPPPTTPPLKDYSVFRGVPSPPPPPRRDLCPLFTSPVFKGSNLPTSPSPPPPSAPPPGVKGRGPLSRTMNLRSQSLKKLKPLHCLKISSAVSGSLCAEAQKCSDAPKTPEIDISELESLFSAAVPTSGQGSSGGKRNSGTSMWQKPEKVQLVDHMRAFNCEIVLFKMKIPLHDMLSSVLALEDSALDVDQVENLIKFCPTMEEMETLKGYKGEKEKLGRCEQFMLELMQVPRIESRLRVFSFKIQFEPQVSELRKSLNIVISAADQIKGSSKLRTIMQTILSLGNALNQETARGSAVGFRLDSLLKLTETRARNNKMTLMHYLCKVLAEKLPELLDFSEDLSSLEPCAKIQLKFLAEEMQAISKGLEKVVQELSMSENDGAVSENFRKALKEFLCYAEAEVRSLVQLYSGVGRNVDTLIRYFGEDPARCPFEQVITTLLNFRRMFNQALEDNRKQLEFEREKAEKEALEKQKMSNGRKPVPLRNNVLYLKSMNKTNFISPRT